MYISRQLKQQNIAEYLLYMWQVEDLIRANGCDIGQIRRNVVDTYPSLTDPQRQELTQWYEDLINMMHDEGVMQKGHLQINKNIIVWLTDLLPFIVELRAKGADRDVPELETCFDAMYGVWMLKLQKKEVSEDTQKAVKAISDLLAMLAGYYIKEKKGELDLD